MGWVVDNGKEAMASYYPAASFHKKFYRPDVIRLLPKAGSVSHALELLNEAQPATSISANLPPTVVITWPDQDATTLKEPELEVRAVAQSRSNQPVTVMGLLVDGRPYNGPESRKKVTAKIRDSAVRESWSVRLEPGVHRLTALAESGGSVGNSDPVEVTYEEKRAARPRLFVLAVGVSKYPDPLRLHYAAADARALADVLRAKSPALFESVEAKILLDEQATRPEIISKLTWLRQTMRDQDVGLVFFSGHGAYRDNTFYLLSVDAKVDDNLEWSAVAADQFKKILATTKGRLVVMLDACHSGAETANRTPRVQSRRLVWARPEIPIWRGERADLLLARVGMLGEQREGGGLLGKQVRPLTDDLVLDLSRDEHGVITMSSSTGSEVSVESAALGHGYFTQALIEGLSGQADSNKDGLVYVNELDTYLSDRVKFLSQDRQHPVTAKPQSVVPFALTRTRP